MNLAYLLSPTFQFSNVSGRPLTDGYVNVYISGTRSKYYAFSDFDGTLHPFNIPLNALGSAVILVSPAHSYDIYVYNSVGTLQMSRYNITPATGEGTVITDVTTLTSKDGTVDITANSSTNYDLSIATKIAELKEYTDQAKNDAIESANTSIADLDNKKKDKQNALNFNGSATKTVKKITQNSNGELNVEFEDIDLPGYNISSSDGSINVSSTDGNVNLTLPSDVVRDSAYKHIDAATSNPLMDGKASVGNSLKYAREDHVHPTDTSRASASHTHGSITNDGKIGSTADLAVVTSTSGVVTTADLTTASPTVPTSGTTTSLEFIDTVDQDSKGKISATKKAVTVDSTYSSTGTNPVNGKAIAAAIGGLDSNKTSTDGVNVQVKVTETEGKISAVNVTTDNTENKNNKVSEWQTTPDNTHYPSEKLVKDAINAKADLTKSSTIFDGYVRRMNENPGWRRIAYKQFNDTNTNINALFRLYLIGSNTAHIGLGYLFANIRFDSSGSAPDFRECYLMSHKPLGTSIKLKVVGVAGNAVVEVWVRPPNFSMLMLSCIGNGLDVVARPKDWNFEEYFYATDPEPVEDTANHIYVFSGTTRSVQLNIDSPTNNNLVAMDENGLVKDSGIRITSTDVANWNGKQNRLTFDSAPTAGSNNPVTSDGIKTAIDTVNAKGLTIKEISGEQVICFE